MPSQSGELRELDVMIRKHIQPGLTDLYFHDSPILKWLQANTVKTFPGGDTIQVNFQYAPLKGGFFARGASFDITRRQTEQGMTFTPKWIVSIVSEYLEDLRGLMKSPDKAFDRLDTDMQNAAASMSARLEIAVFGEGVSDPLKLNGLAEICNDASTTSWTGSTYSTYGTLSRSNAQYGLKLKGGIVDVNGPITYNVLVREHAKMKDGTEEPELIISTNLCYAYIKEKFQAQQIFQAVKDPTIGFRGFAFENATILSTKYCPGTQGVNDTDIGNYYDANGETMWMLTPKYLHLYVSDDELFGFGWTGFKPAQDNLTVAGQQCALLNLVCDKPCAQKQFKRITS